MEFSRYFGVDDLVGGAAERAIEAEPNERQAVAKRLGLPSVDYLRADLSIAARGRSDRLGADVDGLVVRGSVRAEVRLVCVASLEEFETRIDDAFTVEFGLDPSDPEGEGDREVDLAREDPPEPFDGAGVDLGEIATQQLALAIDPHPRRPELAPVDMRYDGPAGEPGQASPFAVLRRPRSSE